MLMVDLDFRGRVEQQMRDRMYGCTILTHDTSHILAISRIYTIKINIDG